MEVVQRSVLGVLNKLAPEKFETLMGQVDRIVLDTDDKMSVAIDFIFKNSESYARTCGHVSKKKSFAGAMFRKKIITKCQDEFEGAMKLHESLRVFEERILKEEDDKKRVELMVERHDKMRTFRKRMTGNIRFIGELLNQRMLTEKIMMYCVDQLYEAGTDETMCKLLATIGNIWKTRGVAKTGST